MTTSRDTYTFFLSPRLLMTAASHTSYEISAYLRVASLAIAGYDYLQTLPFELRMWREAWKGRQLTLSSTLFLLIRYLFLLLSWFLIVINRRVQQIYQHPRFDSQQLQLFLLRLRSRRLPQILCDSFAIQSCTVNGLSGDTGASVPQMLSSFASRLKLRCQGIQPLPQICKDRSLLTFVLFRGLQRVWNGSPLFRIEPACLSSGVHRPYWKVGVPNKRFFILHLKLGSSCGSHSPTSAWGGWVSYVVAIIYNFVTTVVCIFFLLKMKTSNGSMMSRVTRMMLVDGIWYFVALTAINFVNLLFNRLPSLSKQAQQTAAASLGYCVTWIMSQRLLIHLYEASVERRNESIGAAVTITQQIAAARDVSHAIRSQFESKNGRGFDLTVPDFDLESAYYAAPMTEKDAEVHVRIERTVKMERMPRVYNLEDYSRNARSTVTSRSTHS
ncbi:hypothetical protein MVEN_01965100 [Mycena venus]|uniref:DUF6533 domain-containing protein n=1 Tax=Mycena venus TaxID=2733690 RepID=A0A8H7CJX8_9AGAR|nr:hypothetical protein MVEN_01965100 [Mycena venus]